MAVMVKKNLTYASQEDLHLDHGNRLDGSTLFRVQYIGLIERPLRTKQSIGEGLIDNLSLCCAQRSERRRAQREPNPSSELEPPATECSSQSNDLDIEEKKKISILSRKERTVHPLVTANIKHVTLNYRGALTQLCKIKIAGPLIIVKTSNLDSRVACRVLDCVPESISRCRTRPLILGRRSSPGKRRVST